MGFADDLGEKVKNSYYFFEDKWYATLDKIDSKIPVYKVIDPIDNIIPSFILFLLIILFLVILLGYLIQFGNEYEIIFTTYDSTDKSLLGGVSLVGIINDELFEGTTNQRGIYTKNGLSNNKNIYEIIGTVLFGANNQGSLGVLNARKTGYRLQEEVDIDFDKEQSILLEPLPVEPEEFKSKAIVNLIDDETQSIIIDSTKNAFIKFECNNKNINVKTIKDGTDGSIDGDFELNEPNCEFKITGANSPGYEEKNTSTTLPKNLDKHRITMYKETPNLGRVRILVKNVDGNGISNVSVMLNDIELITNNDGVATNNSVEPGNYLITVLDENYFPITPADNLNIDIRPGELKEYEIVLIRVGIGSKRKIHFKLYDLNSDEVISGAEVSLLYIKEEDGENVVIDKDGKISKVSNSPSETDTNGEYKQTGVTTNEEGELVAIINNDGYLIHVFRPTLLRLDENPQEVFITKANEDNSGFARVKVTDPENVSFEGANAYVLIDFNENNFSLTNVPLPNNEGILTNEEGIAFFSRLPSGDKYSYSAGAKFLGEYGESESEKTLDANETLDFNVIIDLSSSSLSITLREALSRSIINDNAASLKLFDEDNQLLENLNYSNNKFTSSLIRKDKKYTIRIEIDDYVNTSVPIKNLQKGNNDLSILLWEDPSDSDGVVIDEDNITDGNVIVMLTDIYEKDDKIWTEESTARIMNTDDSYIARLDIIAGKNGLDYNKILGMIRLEGGEIENIYTNPQEFLNTADSFTCSNVDEDSTPKENRGDEYYILSGDGCKNSTLEGIVAGARWTGNIEEGVYSLAIRFKVTDENNIRFTYRAREFDSVSDSETRLKTTSYPIGIPFRNGFYINVELNETKNIFSETGEIKSGKVKAEEENLMNIKIYNETGNLLTGGKLVVYSYQGIVNNFNEASSGNGKIEIDGSKKKTISNNITIPNKDFEEFDVNLTTDEYNADQYIVILADFGNEKIIGFLNTTISGNRIFLNTEFFTGIPNQFFDGTIGSRFGEPIIERLNVETFRNCDPVQEVKSYSYNKDSDFINENYFGFYLNGSYTSSDCLKINIVSSNKNTRELFGEYNETIYASNNDALDVGLGCVDIKTSTGEDEEKTIDWEDSVEMILHNTCSFDVKVNIETGLVCDNCEDEVRIYAGVQEIYTLEGKNNSYDDSISAPNFSDLLGIFPVYVKAKKTSDARARFSLADKFIIHLKNDDQCFAIKKDSLDFSDDAISQQRLIFESNCQYLDIENYFIPKASISAYGYSLENPYANDINLIDFSAELLVDGGGYIVQRRNVNKEAIGGSVNIRADEVSSTPVSSDVERYSVVFDFDEDDIETSYGSNWEIFKIQINITDFNYNNDKFGAKPDINTPMKINYIDGTTEELILDDIISLNPFGCKNTTSYCSLGNFFGEGHAGEGELIFALMYQDLPKPGKISSFEIDFIGNPDKNYLEFRITPELKYQVEKIDLLPGTGSNSESIINIGNFSILKVENANFIISKINNLAAFNSDNFITKLNPTVSIKTNNPKVSLFVDRGYLAAKYLGEDITEFNDGTIEVDITEEFDSGLIYGKVNIIDYVDKTTAAGRTISGDN